MSSSSSQRALTSPLSEQAVQEAFHYLLQDALIQARAEGLMSREDMANHDTDLQIIASSLALYFAALTARGDPPCIPFPKSDSLQLSVDTCPPSFASFFHLWQGSVARIQRLKFDYRHDLALLLCEKEPISSPIRMEVANLARDLKAVALDIVQVSNQVLRESIVSDTFPTIEKHLSKPIPGRRSNSNPVIAERPIHRTSNKSTSFIFKTVSPTQCRQTTAPACSTPSVSLLSTSSTTTTPYHCSRATGRRDLNTHAHPRDTICRPRRLSSH
jgi:hypothetical protein